jgi:protein subunit release factor B
MAKEILFSVTKKDFRVDTFRSGGKGGQNQNKVNSGVRVVHEASGAVGEARDERDQHVNKKRAFERCIQSKTFQAWLKTETARVTGVLAKIDEKVDQEMKAVKVETRDESGKWVDGLTEENSDGS